MKKNIKFSKIKEYINNSVNKQLGLNSSGRSYVFDRSGWTW